LILNDADPVSSVGAQRSAWSRGPDGLEPLGMAGLRNMVSSSICGPPMMRIASAKVPRDRGLGAHDQFIDIAGPPRDIQPGHGLGHHLLLEPHQRHESAAGRTRSPLSMKERK
jgi:hypothetical protein